jgi:hypothetical protein
MNTSENMKRCCKCKEEKPLDRYQKSKGSRDGFQPRCRECHSLAMKEYRESEKGRRATENWTEETRKSGRKKEWDSLYRKTKAGIMSKKRSYEKERYHSPEKIRARWTTSNLLRSGKIVRPEKCSRCNCEGRIEAHHPDYSLPKKVIWLCHICHTSEHKSQSTQLASK